ncbi:MAG: hypothetical protein KBC83_03605 [Candidatus Moranbacteria bacterium]|jgi:hypothetical protein|nr:hypothetical protein [Candidatus Moranbacteria bacterium]MBP9801723.1 hypothetical protein [Candidatus Moranbacteria bacterium]
MPQTFFIDSDEEIISVIGYLRKSPEIENCFVFPKRSLVLQSAVNLRLFQREAEKQGKRIVIISQDENGRQLAERVGIPTKEYAAEINSLRPEVSGLNTEKGGRQMPSGELNSVVRDERSPEMPLSSHLGSDTFSSSGAPLTVSPQIITQRPPQTFPQQQESMPAQDTRRLRIRDTSPRYQTALNSVQSDIESPAVLSAKPVQQPVYSEKPRIVQQPAPPIRQQSNSMPTLVQNKEDDSSGRNQRLERFFRREPVGTSPAASYQGGMEDQAQLGSLASQSVSLPPMSPPVKTSPKKTSSWKIPLFFLGGIIVLLGVGAAIYFFLPKASILITPHDITHDVEAKFEGRTIAPIGNQDDDVVPVRKIEKNYESMVTTEASGKALSGNQKARGTLIITNEYSSDTQPLIATTRFETSDGKIFRLAESVTVPGMTIVDGKRQPGIAEAVVIADAPGDEYNINPTDFTIPGFKNGVKYEKIRAKSSKGFSGGGGSDESMLSITKENIDSAAQKLKEQAKQDFLVAIEQDLLPDERILIDSIEVIDTQMGELPLAGSLGERFDIKGGFTGRAYVVSEKILKEKLAHRNLPERKGISFRVTDATLSFQNVLPRYDEDKVTFSVLSTLMLSSVIETDKLQEELLGLDEEGIKSILEKHAEIKRIEVNFSPEFLFHNIPKNEERVSVQVISE